MTTPTDILTLKQLAAEYNVSINTIHTALKRRRLYPVAGGERHALRIRRAEFGRWNESRKERQTKHAWNRW